jgi:hypothetical protein
MGQCSSHRATIEPARAGFGLPAWSDDRIRQFWKLRNPKAMRLQSSRTLLRASVGPLETRAGPLVARGYPDTALRSFPTHCLLDVFDRRSLAAGLNRCSAPCGVIPPTAIPTSRQLAPWFRAAIADS